MNRFASSLLGKAVLLKREQAIVGLIEEIIIDPATGLLAGFTVREGFGKKKLKALSEKDIVGIGDNFIMIKGLDSLGELDEIVRLKNVMDTNTKIFNNKVYTVSGKYLGRVLDFSIDMLTGQVTRLYVRPALFFGILLQQLVISVQQIISIEKDRITVEDTLIRYGKKSSSPIERQEPGAI